MAIRDLSDMYALSPRACGLRAYTSSKSPMAMLQPLHISQCMGGLKDFTGVYLRYIMGYNYIPQAIEIKANCQLLPIRKL